jgi:hypothetical protein
VCCGHLELNSLGDTMKVGRNTLNHGRADGPQKQHFAMARAKCIPNPSSPTPTPILCLGTPSSLEAS